MIVVAIGPPGAWVMLYKCQGTGSDGIVTTSLSSNFEPGRVEIPAGPTSMRDEIGCSRCASAEEAIVIVSAANDLLFLEKSRSFAALRMTLVGRMQGQ